MKYLGLILSALCLLGAGGCGKNAAAGRLPVSGKVTLKGSPLDRGSIQFMSPDPGGPFGGGGVISNGEYSIPENQGVPVGKYKVVISSGAEDRPVSEDEMPGESGPPAEERIPPEYNVDSQRIVEVSAGKENVFNFDIP